MFVDYYAILEIHETATIEEIKKAYRIQCIKWHPDKNPNIDTTERMQLINEAYLMLKDAEARAKFDAEYQRFKAFRQQEQRNKTNAQEEQQQAKSSYENKHYSNEYKEYSFVDEELKNWMKNARKQSVGMAQQAIRDFKGMIKAGVKEGVKETGRAFTAQIVISIVVLIVLAISRGCH